MAKELWDEFDEKIDVEGLAADAKEAAENGGGNFKEVPLGNYEVEINKLELTKSKKGDPMLSIWFKIVAGEYKGSLIFYNQVMSQGFGIHNANEMLRSLDSGVEVEFVSFKKYHKMLLDIVEAIDGNLEYELKYDKNSKGYNTYEIKDVFEK
ncbi:DUF669 domain-containing protein [Clostridium sp. DSM 100503]|jgi:hypothetical protein|uniref:DUF669 domain-containing protein n=1 Tax=Clostridium sp. DSM 100503 TaxID=2963282 RepID=UPI002149F8C7|nr:DUF669 domain-containing protein [Clostridium sp. DSM 100503]MCR1953050.1 DUF669 domain-containing protein [Clostridium sp. DSM 100503]